MLPLIKSFFRFELLLVFNATFNNISVISWLLPLLVEETGVHRSATSHWQTLSHNVVSSTPRLNNINFYPHDITEILLKVALNICYVWLSMLTNYVWLSLLTNSVWLSMLTHYVWLSILTNAVWLSIFTNYVWLSMLTNSVWLSMLTRGGFRISS